MDDQERLESVCGRKVTVGSNPTLSAIRKTLAKQDTATAPTKASQMQNARRNVGRSFIGYS